MAKKFVGANGRTYVEKKPFYKRWWFIALIVIIFFGALGSKGGKDNNSKTETQIKAEDSKNGATENKKEEIVYEKVSAKEMLDLLEKNALKAEKTYQDKYLEIIGQINVIDSDGKYINIEPVGATFTLTGIQLYIKNEEQKKVIMELSKKSKVVAKGKVKSVGEVLGYSLDLEEITPAEKK